MARQDRMARNGARMAPVARHTTFPSNMPSGTIVIEIVTALGAASPETISGFSAVVDGDTFTSPLKTSATRKSASRLVTTRASRSSACTGGWR